MRSTGAGTQIGKVINNAIPDDLSDSIVDGIVGLFGGETNADRDKKQKELEEKQAKEWEERKKIRETEKKKLEDDQKRLDEQKKMAVVINQPKDNPVPVIMTDEKGVPIVSSVRWIGYSTGSTGSHQSPDRAG